MNGFPSNIILVHVSDTLKELIPLYKPKSNVILLLISGLAMFRAGCGGEIRQCSEEFYWFVCF
jgi:hypothetical protein